MAPISQPPVPVFGNNPWCKVTPCPSGCMPMFTGRREHELRQSLLHKRGCTCAKCRQPVDFYESDLHHTNPDKKRFTLDQRTMGAILDGMGEEKGMLKILDEFAKTILLCRPCHKEVHQQGIKEFFDQAYWPKLKKLTRKYNKMRGLDEVA